MINKYVSCEDCVYQEVCHQFDAFSGCNNGMPVTDIQHSKDMEDNFVLLSNHKQQ